MPRRVVFFGATGYTGRLVTARLLAAGARPLLAGRSRKSIEALARESGGLEWAVADSGDPASLRRLVEPEDVLLTTVGPFSRVGNAAVSAAVEAGATYLDSTGEPDFIRRVFEVHGPRANASGATLLTAMGYDYVPGNFAAALALERVGEGEAHRVEVAYFMEGGRHAAGSASTGTRASMVGAMVDPGYTFRDGRIETERAGRRARDFDLDGSRPAFSCGTSEQFTLPRLRPELAEVDVYNGWLGGISRAMPAISAVNSAFFSIPGTRRAANSLSARLLTATRGGPDPEAPGAPGSAFIAIVRDAAGNGLSTCRMQGPNGYGFTADFMARAAVALSEADSVPAGAIGPVEAFGLDRLAEICAAAGLTWSIG